MKLVTTGGMTRDFGWEGPDLTMNFGVGDQVSTSDVDQKWTVLQGALHTIATHYAEGFGSVTVPWLDAPPPFAGMTFALEPECEDFLTLIPTLGGASITLKSHETGMLGGFEVHNGGIYGSHSVEEFGYGESITPLGRRRPDGGQCALTC